MTRKKIMSVVAALALVTAGFAAPALARKGEEERGNAKSRPAQTKMRFKLDSHQWAAGDTVTGSVSLVSRAGKSWAPLAGATVAVFVDGDDVGEATTDAEGKATVSWGPATDGDHNMKVRYSGDDTHKKSQRAQGFEVGDGGDDDDDADDDDEPETDPTPTPTPTETTL